MYNRAEKDAENIIVNFPIDHVFQASIRALTNSNEYKVKDTNQVLNRILFQTKASAWSWGEKMTLQLNDMGNKTELIIISELGASSSFAAPNMRSFLGKKNKKNIDAVLNTISKYL